MFAGTRLTSVLGGRIIEQLRAESNNWHVGLCEWVRASERKIVVLGRTYTCQVNEVSRVAVGFLNHFADGSRIKGVCVCVCVCVCVYVCVRVVCVCVACV